MTTTAKEIINEIEFFQDYDYNKSKKKIRNKSRKRSRVKEKKTQIHNPRPIILKDNSDEQFEYLKLLIAENALDYLNDFMENIFPDLHIHDQSRALYIMACLLGTLHKIERDYFKQYLK